METIAFYTLSFLMLGFGLAVVTLKNLYHSALALVASLFGVAGLYVLLQADFLAATQVLIYIGAVVVLAIFAIMLTSKIFDKTAKQSNEQVLPAFFVAASMIVLLISTFNKTVWLERWGGGIQNTTAKIGELLLTQYLLPFEIVSVVLLAALVGAIVIARED